MSRNLLAHDSGVWGVQDRGAGICEGLLVLSPHSGRAKRGQEREWQKGAELICSKELIPTILPLIHSLRQDIMV